MTKPTENEIEQELRVLAGKLTKHTNMPFHNVFRNDGVSSMAFEMAFEMIPGPVFKEVQDFCDKYNLLFYVKTLYKRVPFNFNQKVALSIRFFRI